MTTAVMEGLNVRLIAYGDAIDLLERAYAEHEVGGLIVFPTHAACGRRTIVIVNQLDTEECVRIEL